MIELNGHTGIVTALAYSPDGQTLATGATDGQVKLWDVVGGRERLTCVPLRRDWGVSSVAISSDGKLVAAGFRGYALVWSLASGQMLQWIRRSAEETFNPDPMLVAFHPSAERLAIATGKDALVEVEPRGGQRLTSFPFPDRSDYALPLSPWARLRYIGEQPTAGSTDTLYLFGQVRRSLHWPNGLFVALASDASGRWLAAARGRGVALCDLSQEGVDLRRTLALKVGERVNAVALTSDARTLLAGGDDWTVHVWDAATGQKRTDYNWRIGQVVALATSPDGMTAAVSGRKGPQVLIWDLE